MVKNILLHVGCRKSPRMEVCETGTDRASSTSQLPKIAVGQKHTHQLHVTLSAGELRFLSSTAILSSLALHHH